MRPVLRYLLALLGLSVLAARARPRWALASIAMMFGNNVVFFLVWVIYFARFSSLAGWQQQDVAVLVGMVSWAFGLTSFLTGGMRDIAQTIVDGRLDLHLGRPCHPLPTLLLSRSVPAGIGDLLSAFVFWFWLGGRAVSELPLLLLMATAAAIVVCATTVIIQCLVFWRPQAIALCEELFNTLLMVTYYPQHPFGLTVRIVLFTVFPAAFVAFLPAEAIRHPEAVNVLGMLGAALVYSLLAVAVFDRGLRRYASGNGMLELR
jgi:ABC-2 type transport system permease protein